MAGRGPGWKREASRGPDASGRLVGMGSLKGLGLGKGGGSRPQRVPGRIREQACPPSLPFPRSKVGCPQTNRSIRPVRILGSPRARLGERGKRRERAMEAKNADVREFSWRVPSLESESCTEKTTLTESKQTPS